MNVDNKISVFISSKCGGNHLNYSQLVNDIAVSKHDLAKNSIRANYDIVRRGLKQALIETDLFEVYVFEDSDGSTQNVVKDYLFQLDQCDVCIFLIDNFDEQLSEGLLKEISRAEKNNKKSLYIFLNDPLFEKTQLQKEIYATSGIHCKEINDIREFINEGYDAIINDVLTIYKKYCGDYYIEKENYIEGSISQDPIVFINKEIFDHLPKVSKKIVSLFYNPDFIKDTESSELDEIAVIVLEYLFGERKFSDIPIEDLLNQLQQIQSEDLFEVVQLRWKAIQLLIKERYDEAISILSGIPEKYSASATIPEWLITNVLIDIRNIYSSKESFIYSPEHREIQQQINEKHSIYHFPLNDKFQLDICRTLWERKITSITSSPGTTTIENNEEIIKYIGNYLLVSMYYGFYTGIWNTVEEIKKVAFEFVEKTDQLNFKTQLIKLSVLSGSDSDFKKVMRKYKSSLSFITKEEIGSLYYLVENKVFPYQRNYWKIFVFREIGYYLSDQDFEGIFAAIFKLAINWIDNPNNDISFIFSVIEAFKQNVKRIHSKEVTLFITSVFEKSYKRYFREVIILLIELIRNERLVAEDLDSLVTAIEKVLDDPTVENNDIGIENSLLYFRFSYNKLGNFDKVHDIDKIVEEHFLSYYRREYKLEIDKETHSERINEFIDAIKIRTNAQGKSGVYTGYSINPYRVIRNIINGGVSLSLEQFVTVIENIKVSLLSPKNSFRTKIDAVILLIFLRSQEYSFNTKFESYFDKILNQIDEITKSDSYGMFENESKISFEFYWTILKIRFGLDCTKELLQRFAIVNNLDDFEKINSISAIFYLLDCKNFSIDEIPELSIIVQQILTFCYAEAFEIRRIAVLNLYLLITTRYSSFVIDQIAKMIDDENIEVKLEVVNQIEKIKEYNLIAYNSILGRAKIDNNFLLREKIEKYIEE